MSITILGKDIPLYGLLFFTGIGIAAAIAGAFLIKRRNIEGWDFVCAAVFALIGAVIGAKLLALIVSWELVIQVMKLDGYTLYEKIDALMKNGFVFYGGLIGGILGFKVYGWIYKTKMSSFFDVGATVLPLGHAFGRVGCFLSGCCYGVEHHGWFSYVYTESTIAEGAVVPLGVPLFPVQLVEAACLLVLFAGLMVLFFKNKKKTPWLQTLAYACSYAVVRFVLEFFRGDKERGGFLGISTSQWISILLVVGSALLIVYLTVWQKRKEAKACECEKADGSEDCTACENGESVTENTAESVSACECSCASAETPVEEETVDKTDTE